MPGTLVLKDISGLKGKPPWDTISSRTKRYILGVEQHQLSLSIISAGQWLRKTKLSAPLFLSSLRYSLVTVCLFVRLSLWMRVILGVMQEGALQSSWTLRLGIWTFEAFVSIYFWMFLGQGGKWKWSIFKYFEEICWLSLNSFQWKGGRAAKTQFWKTLLCLKWDFE